MLTVRRFVLANTEALHDKIGQLSNRVRHLEDALAEVHSYRSIEPHPLLSEQLLRIKQPLERERQEAGASPPHTPEPDPEDVPDTFGSLYA